MNQKQDLLAPLLMSMLQQVSGLWQFFFIYKKLLTFSTMINLDVSPSSDRGAILLKESVYSAIGICAYNLYDYIDFDSWFASKLFHEANSNDSMSPL